MRGERGKLYDQAEDYFDLEGHAVMTLTPEAALEVCHQAAGRGFMVVRIEGGIWHNPGFESRLDCIWDGLNPPVTRETAEENNKCAAEFIVEQQEKHDVFILTDSLLEGYRSKLKSK